MTVRRLPSPAMVVACLALIVALGGSAYAVTSLPKNSVGTKQLKNNAVVSSKVKDNSLTGADVNESSLGQVPNAATLGGVGPSGFVAAGQKVANASHADNADHANTATDATNASALGGTPASSFVQFGSTLRSGGTETGVWATGGGSSTSGLMGTGLRFYPPLSAALDSSHVHVGISAQCSGPGNAERGYLCVYDESDLNATFNSIADGQGGVGAKQSGAALFFDITAAGGYAEGEWAVTAP